MNITQYNFGRIHIDGKTYDKDVVVYQDHIDSPWWRKEGHKLFVNDLTHVLEVRPDVLVIGTGYYGCMQVPDEVLEELRKRGIEPRVYNTQTAIDEYNRLEKRHVHVSAALHLTC